MGEVVQHGNHELQAPVQVTNQEHEAHQVEYPHSRHRQVVLKPHDLFRKRGFLLDFERFMEGKTNLTGLGTVHNEDDQSNSEILIDLNNLFNKKNMTTTVLIKSR